MRAEQLQLDLGRIARWRFAAGDQLREGDPCVVSAAPGAASSTDIANASVGATAAVSRLLCQLKGAKDDVRSSFVRGDVRPLIELLNEGKPAGGEQGVGVKAITAAAWSAASLLAELSAALAVCRENGGSHQRPEALMLCATAMHERIERLRASAERISAADLAVFGRAGRLPIEALNRLAVDLRTASKGLENRVAELGRRASELRRAGDAVGLKTLAAEATVLQEELKEATRAQQRRLIAGLGDSEALIQSFQKQLEHLLASVDAPMDQGQIASVIDALDQSATGATQEIAPLQPPPSRSPAGLPTLAWDFELSDSEVKAPCAGRAAPAPSTVRRCRATLNGFVRLSAEGVLTTQGDAAVEVAGRIDLGISVLDADVEVTMAPPSPGQRPTPIRATVALAPRGTLPNVRIRTDVVKRALWKLGWPEELAIEGIGVEIEADLSAVKLSFSPHAAIASAVPLPRVEVRIGNNVTVARPDVREVLQQRRREALTSLLQPGRFLTLLGGKGSEGLQIAIDRFEPDADSGAGKLRLGSGAGLPDACSSLDVRLYWDRTERPTRLAIAGLIDPRQADSCLRALIAPALEAALSKAGLQSLEEVAARAITVAQIAVSNDEVRAVLIVRDGALGDEGGRLTLSIAPPVGSHTKGWVSFSDCRPSLDGSCSPEALVAGAIVPLLKKALAPAAGAAAAQLLEQAKAQLVQFRFAGHHLRFIDSSQDAELDLLLFAVAIVDDSSGEDVATIHDVIAHTGPRLDFTRARVASEDLQRLTGSLSKQLETLTRLPDRIALEQTELEGSGLSGWLVADLQPLSARTRLARCGIAFPAGLGVSDLEFRCEGEDLSSTARAALAKALEPVLGASISQLSRLPVIENSSLEGLEFAGDDVVLRVRGDLRFADDWPTPRALAVLTLQPEGKVAVRLEPVDSLDRYLAGALGKALGEAARAAGGSSPVTDPKFDEGPNGWGLRFGIRLAIPSVPVAFESNRPAWLDRDGFSPPDDIALSVAKPLPIAGTPLCLYDSRFVVPLRGPAAIRAETSIAVGAEEACRTFGQTIARIRAALTFRFAPVSATLDGQLLALGGNELARAHGVLEMEPVSLTSTLETTGALAAIGGFHSDLSVQPSVGSAATSADLSILGIDAANVQLTATWNPAAPASHLKIIGKAVLKLPIGGLDGGVEVPVPEVQKLSANAGGHLEIGGFELGGLGVNFNQAEACTSFSVLSAKLGFCLPSPLALTPDEILRRILEALSHFEIDWETLLKGDLTIRVGSSGRGAVDGGGRDDGESAGGPGDSGAGAGDGPNSQAPVAPPATVPPIPLTAEGALDLKLPKGGDWVALAPLLAGGYDESSNLLALAHMRQAGTNKDAIWLVTYPLDGGPARSSTLRSSKACEKVLLEGALAHFVQFYYAGGSSLLAEASDGELTLVHLRGASGARTGGVLDIVSYVGLFGAQFSAQDDNTTCPPPQAIGVSSRQLVAVGVDEDAQVGRRNRMLALATTLASSSTSMKFEVVSELRAVADVAASCPEEIVAQDLPMLIAWDGKRAARVFWSDRPVEKVEILEVSEQTQRTCAASPSCREPSLSSLSDRAADVLVSGWVEGGPQCSVVKGLYFAQGGRGWCVAFEGLGQAAQDRVKSLLGPTVSWVETTRPAREDPPTCTFEAREYRAPAPAACAAAFRQALMREIVANSWERAIWRLGGSPSASVALTKGLGTAGWEFALLEMSCETAGGEVLSLRRWPSSRTANGGELQRRITASGIAKPPLLWTEETEKRLLALLIDPEDESWSSQFWAHPLGLLLYP